MKLRNDLGSTQKTVKVEAEDRLKHETKNKQTDDANSSERSSTENAKLLKQLKMQLERHRRTVAGFRQKIEKEIERLQRQIEKKSRNVKVGAASSPLDSDFQSEIGTIAPTIVAFCIFSLQIDLKISCLT